MAATDRFRAQHAVLVEVVRRIEPLLDAEKLSVSAVEVRRLLSVLMGKLTLHLAMEDNVLYPRLAHHQDAKVREVATRFIGEMSGIKPAIESFSNKWTKNEIQTNAALFCAEAKKIFAALGDRIRRENTELYPLADRKMMVAADRV
jgi:iron-sulfur cluster repair protein YtfE (RIC family)